jgi:hypothetical protein
VAELGSTVLSWIRDIPSGALGLCAKMGSDEIMAAWLEVVTLASTPTDGNVIIANTYMGTIDGTALTNGIRVLLKHQTTASQNGTYSYSTSTHKFTTTTDTFEDQSTLRCDLGVTQAHTEWTLKDTTNRQWVRQLVRANVKDFGSLGNGGTAHDGIISSLQPTILTSAAAGFTAANVPSGTPFLVAGAGANGTNLVTTATFATSTTVTLAASGSPVSGAAFVWGTDDSLAIATAITALSTAGGALLFPPGVYAVGSASMVTVPSNVQVTFEEGATLAPSGQTVAINGRVTGHPTQQIFGGSGSVGAMSHTAGSGPLITVTGTYSGYPFFQVKITTGGAVGVAAFQYSLNGGTSWLPASPASTAATYAVPSTGVTIAFRAGTYVTTDVYKWTSGVTTPGTTGRPTVTVGGNPLGSFSFLISVGPLSCVVITNPGSGYNVGNVPTPPTVSFSGPGTGAAATATVPNAAPYAVTSVALTNVGLGYSSPPMISFGGPGTGASATAILSPAGTLGTMTFQYSLNGGANWSGIVSTVPGSSYTYVVPGTGVTVTFSSGTYSPGDMYSWTSTPAILLTPLASDQFCVRWWGARGDGATDDTAAIQAAELARDTCSGTVFFPQGTYNISSELRINSLNSWKWIGEWTGQGNGGLVATVPMRSLVAITGTGKMQNLVLNSNSQAKYCILRLSDAFSHYDHVLCQLATVDGIHAGNLSSPMVLSPVRNSPGGSTLVTVAPLIDTFADVGLITIQLQVVATGGLGVAQVQVSTTGGAPGAYQTLYAQIYLATPATTPGGAGFSAALGILVNMDPNHTYALNETYSFDVSYTPGSGNINDTCIFDGCQAISNGTIYATADLSGTFPGAKPATGTVATTSGGQVIVGTGTQFRSMGIRSGDFAYVGGVAYQIVCVMDDTHLAIGWGANAPIQVTQSGVGFGVAVGSGYYEEASRDSNINTIRGGLYRGNQACGLRCAGLFGPNIYDTQIDGYNFAAISLGEQGATHGFGAGIVRPYLEGGLPGVPGYWLASFGVTIVEANSISPASLYGNQAIVLGAGALWGISGAASNLQSHTLGIIPTPTNLANAGSVIPAPDVGSNLSAAGSFQTLTLSSGDLELTGAPLGNPTAAGQILILHNRQGGYLTIRGSEAGLGSNVHLASTRVCLGAGEMLTLISDDTATNWYQLGAISEISYPSTTLNTGGAGNNRVLTTDATQTEIYRWYVAASACPAAVLKADVIATNADGSQAAAWIGIEAMYANGAAVGTMTICETRGTNGGSPPAGWNVSLADPSGFAILSVTGAAATNITWKCKANYLGAP